MLDISTGRFVINEREGWEFAPFFSRDELMGSKFWRDNQSNRTDLGGTGRTFLFDHLPISDHRMSMELHIGRSGYIDKVTLRTDLAANIQEWFSKPGWEETALKQKRIHDQFLAHETSMSPDLLSEKDELSISAEWGGITSVMDLSAEPDVRIVIRYRNLSEADKEKYLTLGKKYLHGEK
ncbi:MAG: hypothetical protein K6F48_00160 [Paludibacteraceae bacterium]|nr:hypothetical protein [Paludibacteraceae bacterium]